MTADPGTSGIPAVGTVTEANAGTLLTEQLAAVAAFSMDLTADEDDWLEVFSAERGQSSSAYFLRRKAKRETLPDKLKEAIPAITQNMEKIVAKLPEVDSYTVQAGFPWGVSVAVTFKPKRVPATPSARRPQLP